MDITINNTTDPILLKRILDAEKSINQAWKVIGIVLVFWMHAGFSMLEAGSIRENNVQNILFKNILNVVATTIVWWTLGYAHGCTKGFSSSSNFPAIFYKSSNLLIKISQETAETQISKFSSFFVFLDQNTS